MDCQKVKEKLYLLIDGELDNNESLLVKEHILSCPLCTLMLENEKKIDLLIRQCIPKTEAPFALKEAILNRLEESTKPRLLPRIIFQQRPVLISILVVLLLAISSVPIIIKKQVAFPVFSASVSSHIKFLQGALPLEITSRNPSEIKNWFQGKLDFAVTIPDLSGKGANLVGARICYLKDREAAYLIYEKESHNISVFVMDTRGLKIPKAKRVSLGNRLFYMESEKGYQSALCIEKGGDVGCIFVSDLPEEELMRIIT
jgi:mycothiol system anti-sigma-R factor